MLDTATMTSAGPVQQRLDEGGLRAIQIRVFVLCTLVTMLDGIDNQSIGVIAPLMSRDLGLDKTALGSIFSVTQIGATIGALLFGVVGDRFGRKLAIIFCVSMMTVFTLLTAIVPTFELLIISRFFAGLGLAGVFSSALALTSEFAPSRLRGTMVSIVYAGYPAGAALGGIMSAAILTTHDWRAVLFIAASIGLVILILPDRLAARIDPLPGRQGWSGQGARPTVESARPRSGEPGGTGKQCRTACARDRRRVLVGVPQWPGAAHAAALRRQPVHLGHHKDHGRVVPYDPDRARFHRLPCRIGPGGVQHRVPGHHDDRGLAGGPLRPAPRRRPGAGAGWVVRRGAGRRPAPA